MKKQTVSIEECGSNSGNADSGSEDVCEEEEEIEEEHEQDEEEDPVEDEPQEVDSCAEPDEDEPNEIESCEEEPNEMDSCEGISCEQYEQCEDELIEEEPCEELEPSEEPFEEELAEEDPAEEEPVEEEPFEGKQIEEDSVAEIIEADDGGLVDELDEQEFDRVIDEEEKEEEVEEEEEEEEEAEEEEEEEIEEEEVEEEAVEEEEEPEEEIEEEEEDQEEDPIEDPREEPTDFIRSDANSSSNVVSLSSLCTTENTKKKRRSKWDIGKESNEQLEEGSNLAKKRRKTRWSDDDSQVKLPPIEIDLEIPKLYARLHDINRKLQLKVVVDDRPQNERSPSPPPLFNNLGIKINTRETRIRSKLTAEMQMIISELIQKSPNFKPPKDLKCPKYFKKLYIPVKEFPEYNFIGLILGPCGNSQKKMEMESGARIKLRGKGSRSEEKMISHPIPSDDEDLHVYIEADNKHSLDTAVAMVEKLLVPVDDDNNKHKLKQLIELAELRGTLRSSNTITFDKCNVCGDTSHPTSNCPLIAPAPQANSFSHDMKFFNSTLLSTAPTTPTMNSSTSHVMKPKKEISDANLFVGYLPLSVDDNKLSELFHPFGPLSHAQVIRDKITNISKGYGFVKYVDHVSAAKAVAHMNGYQIDGKMLAVRIAGIFPTQPQLNPLPNYPGPAAFVQNNLNPMRWPGPPESRLPNTVVTSFPTNSNLPIHNSSFNAQYSGSIDSFQTAASSSLFPSNFVASNELVNFPGYLKSLDSPPRFYNQPTSSNEISSSTSVYNQSVMSNNSYHFQVQFTQNFGGYQMPPN